MLQILHGLASAYRLQARYDDEGPDYLYTLALAYHRTGRNEKAIETAERALSVLSPDDSAKREDYVERLEQYRTAARASDGSQGSPQPGVTTSRVGPRRTIERFQSRPSRSTRYWPRTRASFGRTSVPSSRASAAPRQK